MPTVTHAANRLAAALERNEDLDDHQNAAVETAEVDESETIPEATVGYCVECRDQPYTLLCLGCDSDKFCEVCHMAIHRHGSRKSHKTEACVSPLATTENMSPESNAQPQSSSQSNAQIGDEFSEDDSEKDEEIPASAPLLPGTGSSMRERAKYVPLRLTFEERRMLRLVEATLNVSEYTDKVDVVGAGGSKMRRIQQQLKSVYSVLCGLVVAEDYAAGQALIASSDISSHANFFANAFEITRRYKIMNPDRLRDHYGKLLFLLQDSRIPEIAELFGFDPVIPIRTVYTLLESRGERALALLDDPLVPYATRTIIAENKHRHQIDREIKQKERAIEELVRKYSFGSQETLPKRRYWYSYFAYGDESDEDDGNKPVRSDVLTQEEVRRVLYSLGDANTFLVENRDPVEKMLRLLNAFFQPSGPVMVPEHPSYKLLLGIQSGYEGSRLTHSHSTQFAFVKQTLSMWKHVLDDFYRLWILSEEDFLDPHNPARLRDTGQGYNRVQACPRISNAMRSIIHTCHLECESTGGWVGSSVVHLGDRNVPNALVFIDKYTQVSRILGPLTTVITSIPTIFKENPELHGYLESTFGTEDRLRAIILSDFFRHAFNGSGADNNFDAGSCVDGRLTSAWEWCSRIDKKMYAPVFKLSSVLGFDGRWER